MDDEQPFSPNIPKKKMNINVPLLYLEIIGAPTFRWLWEHCLDSDETRRSEIVALSLEIQRVIKPLVIDSDDPVVIQETLTKIETACRKAAKRMFTEKKLTTWEEAPSGIKCEAGVSYTSDIPEAPELKSRARKKKRKKK